MGTSVGSLVLRHIGPWAHQSVGTLRGHIGPWASHSVGTSFRGHIIPWAHHSAGTSFRGHIIPRAPHYVGTSFRRHLIPWAHHSVGTCSMRTPGWSRKAYRSGQWTPWRHPVKPLVSIITESLERETHTKKKTQKGSLRL